MSQGPQVFSVALKAIEYINAVGIPQRGESFEKRIIACDTDQQVVLTILLQACIGAVEIPVPVLCDNGGSESVQVFGNIVCFRQTCLTMRTLSRIRA